MTLLRLAIFVTAFTAQSIVPPAQPASAPPEHPILQEQLRALLQGMHMIEAQRVQVHESLKNQHGKLPSWFPPDVWSEVEARIEAIDIAQVDLPVYQKYVSQEQADTMILFFQGPTGDEIGQRMAARSLQALHSNPEDNTSTVKTEVSDSELWARRLHELTPAQREKASPVIDSLRELLPRIGEEENSAYILKVNEEFRAVLNAEHGKLEAAEAAAAAASSHSELPH